MGREHARRAGTPRGPTGRIAVPLFDLSAYVDEFNATVVPAYASGRADAGAGQPMQRPARSIMPPGTAATRDFSQPGAAHAAVRARQVRRLHGLRQRLPRQRDPCDVALPESDLDDAHRRVRRRPSRRSPAAEVTAARPVRPDEEVRRGPRARMGRRAGALRHLRRPGPLQGVRRVRRGLRALGHDALFMTDKVDRRAATSESTIDRVARDFRFFRIAADRPRRSIGTSKALADLMLGEHAFGYVGGAGSCAGCGEATAIRMMVAATRQVYGPESMGIVAATGCNTVFGATYPFNPYLVPWTNSLFENAPAVALGIRARLGPGRPSGPPAVGHGRRRRDVRHRLPGARRGWSRPARTSRCSSSTRRSTRTPVARPRPPRSAARSPSCPRSAPRCTGARSRARSSAGSCMAHGEVYVAQTTPAHINHFYRVDHGGQRVPGPGGRDRLLRACMPEHGIADDAASRQARAGGRLAGVPAVHLRPSPRRRG